MVWYHVYDITVNSYIHHDVTSQIGHGVISHMWCPQWAHIYHDMTSHIYLSREVFLSSYCDIIMISPMHHLWCHIWHHRDVSVWLQIEIIVTSHIYPCVTSPWCWCEITVSFPCHHILNWNDSINHNPDKICSASLPRDKRQLEGQALVPEVPDYQWAKTRYPLPQLHSEWK